MTQKAPKVKRDFRLLRQHQQAVAASQEFADRGGQVRDDNPPGYTTRGYEQLAKIKMPLILDQITDQDGKPRIPWTVDEVLGAMKPSITSLSNQFSRRRAAFQMDEAESLGYETILTALWTDKGLAWFAGYCFDKIRASIKRGAKTSGTIRVGESHHEYRDKVRSTDEPLGEGGGTLAETIDQASPIVRKFRCGDYYRATLQDRIDIIRSVLPTMGMDKQKLSSTLLILKESTKKFSFHSPSARSDNQRYFREMANQFKAVIGADETHRLFTKLLPEGARRLGIRTHKSGPDAIFSPTCIAGVCEDGTPCDRCDGRGRITIRESRVIRTPDELAAERARLQEFNRIFSQLTEGLSPKQLLVFILKEGLDEGGSPREISEVAEIMKEKDRLDQVEMITKEIASLDLLISKETDHTKRSQLEVKKEERIRRAGTVQGCGSKNRMTHILDKVRKHLITRQATSKDITEAIDRILDET